MTLTSVQCSDLAAAAAARLAVPTSTLLSSFSQPSTEPEELNTLEITLRRAAAGSLVATALLRGLQLEGVCSQLGTSHAYRLASSIQVALGLGQESGMLVARHAAPLSKTTPMPSAALPTCLADLMCTHLAAVDCCCQLLRQQAGTQLQQALQRTVCQPMKLVIFWYSTVEALAELEKRFPGRSAFVKYRFEQQQQPRIDSRQLTFTSILGPAPGKRNQ